MKVASVYKRSDGLYFHSASQTTAGVWVATAPFLKVSFKSTQAAKGDAVVEVLNASQAPVPHPTNWDDIFAPVLELANVESWEQFKDKTDCCGLRVEGELMSMIPHRSLGPDEGFEPIPELAVRLTANAPPTVIGVALDEAFAHCQR